MGIEDAYLFLREFKEVYSIMWYPNVHVDTIWLKFIPSALKHQAKKWIYSLPTNSIANWEEFVWLFMQEYLPNGKTTRLRNENDQLC